MTAITTAVHDEKHREYQRRYRDENKEKRAAKDKLYRQKNAEKINARRAEYRIKKKTELNEKSLSFYSSNPEIWILSNIKKRCKDRGIPFNLSIDDIKPPDLCPVFGFQLQRNTREGGGPMDNSPAVDRIKPELGYVKGNVIVVSHLANRIKTNATPEQIRAVADFYDQLITSRGNDNGG